MVESNEKNKTKPDPRLGGGGGSEWAIGSRNTSNQISSPSKIQHPQSTKNSNKKPQQFPQKKKFDQKQKPQTPSSEWMLRPSSTRSCKTPKDQGAFSFDQKTVSKGAAAKNPFDQLKKLNQQVQLENDPGRSFQNEISEIKNIVDSIQQHQRFSIAQFLGEAIT